MYGWCDGLDGYVTWILDWWMGSGCGGIGGV